MAKTKAITCNGCELLSINGLSCHEHGCPNTNATWDSEQGEWVRTRTCFECGGECPADQECCTSTAHGVRGKMLEFKLPTEPCANCKRECNPDDLSMCLRCDTRYCKCSWDCPCDRLAREMVQRAGLEVLSCE